MTLDKLVENAPLNENQKPEELITYPGGAVRFPVPVRYDLIPLDMYWVLLNGPSPSYDVVRALFKLCEDESTNRDTTSMYDCSIGDKANSVLNLLDKLLLRTRAGLLEPYAQALYDGSLKYPPHGWKNGLPKHMLLNHALKHLVGYLVGDDTDQDGQGHESHMVWNIMAIIYFYGTLSRIDDEEYVRRMYDFGFQGPESEKLLKKGDIGEKTT